MRATERLRWLEYGLLALTAFGLVLISATQQISYVSIPIGSLLALQFCQRQRWQRRIHTLTKEMLQVEQQLTLALKAGPENDSQSFSIADVSGQLKEIQGTFTQTRTAIAQIQSDLKQYQSALNVLLNQVEILLAQIQQPSPALEEGDLPESLLRFKRDVTQRLIELESLNADLVNVLSSRSQQPEQLEH